MPHNVKYMYLYTYLKHRLLVLLLRFVLIFFIIFILGVYACMYICASHTCLVPAEAQRRHWIHLGLKLQTVMSCCVDTGNWTWKIVSTLNFWTIFAACIMFFVCFLRFAFNFHYIYACVGESAHVNGRAMQSRRGHRILWSWNCDLSNRSAGKLTQVF